jgi:predicted RNA-binding protein with PUA-like domain
MADPKAYGFDNLENDGRTTWDGIKGSIAQRNLGNIKKGDKALIYHTAPDKTVVGIAKVVSDPYPDAKVKERDLVVVDLEPMRRLKNAVPLSRLKQNKKLSGMTFLKIQRISVSPMTEAEFNEIVSMSN